MKVFAQHEQTGLYLQTAPKRWLLDRERATAFDGCCQAVQFLAQHRIRDIQLVLANEDPRHEVVVPGFESVEIQNYSHVLLEGLLAAKRGHAESLRKAPGLRRQLDGEIAQARRFHKQNPKPA